MSKVYLSSLYSFIIIGTIDLSETLFKYFGLENHILSVHHNREQDFFSLVTRPTLIMIHRDLGQGPN